MLVYKKHFKSTIQHQKVHFFHVNHYASVGNTSPKNILYFVLTARQVSFGLKLRNPQQFKFLWMSFRALAVLFQPTSKS